MDGRTLTHDKSSHGLWPGELKMRGDNHIFATVSLVIFQTIIPNIVDSICKYKKCEGDRQ